MRERERELNLRVSTVALTRAIGEFSDLSILISKRSGLEYIFKVLVRHKFCGFESYQTLFLYVSLILTKNVASFLSFFSPHLFLRGIDI